MSDPFHDAIDALNEALIRDGIVLPAGDGWEDVNLVEIEIKPADVEQLVKMRGEEYGEAWLKTGRWIQENLDLLVNAGDIVFCLIMIYSKMVRAAESPLNPDHYLDAAGYAKLAVDHLDRKARQRELLVEKFPRRIVPQYQRGGPHDKD